MFTRHRTLLALVLFAIAFSSYATEQPPAPAARPDLIVVISIDQFPYSYLPRFAPYFATGGFNRFLKGGAEFAQARYPYATTFTGPGHAAIGTGYMPSRNGIVANLWYDRESGTAEYCAEDARVKGGFSPMNLDSDSLGDRLQEKYPGGKVFGVSIKDRAAILMAGRKATAAYWFDSKSATPAFVTSSYYRASNQAMLDDYNKTIPAFVAAHPMWELSGFIPAADLEKVTHDPERLRQYKRQHDGLGLSFPHPIRGADAILYTPFGNDLVLGLARSVIEAEHLGTADQQPDILMVSLSPQDYLGHDYGPDSMEVADSVVRIDRQLAEFFDYLDKNFHDRVTVALTADHGVQSIPEVARDLGRDAGRLDMRNPKKDAKTFADLAPQRLAMERAIAAKLGVKVSNATPVNKGFILFFDEPAVYLNWPRIRELKIDGERVKRAVRDAASEMHGVSGAFTNSELQAGQGQPAGSDLELAVRRAFRADRSGDVIITLKAGYIWDYAATTHGQPVEADQHVPVLFWGTDVKPGAYQSAAAPTDIARSLGFTIGVEAGDPSSRILPCFTTGETAASPGSVAVIKLSTPVATEPKAAGWSMESSSTAEDLKAVLGIVLGEVETSGTKATIVLGDKIGPPARTAAASLRNTVDVEKATEAQLALPAGYVRLDVADIEADKATVRIWTGPIRKANAGEALLDCGRGYMFNLEKNPSGQWVIKTRGVAVC
jgi:predicted AlkP superfamily pyrophosphatase or phosphodiesterase